MLRMMASHTWLRNVLINPRVCSRPAAVLYAQPAQLFGLRGIRSLAPSRVLVRATLQAERPAETAAPFSFADLGLAPGLQQALAEAQITEPTEIQVTPPPSSIPGLEGVPCHNNLFLKAHPCRSRSQHLSCQGWQGLSKRP